MTTATDPVGRLLDLLPDHRRSGSGWSARCPAHDDRAPSLSIARGDDGQALVKCQAGCATEAVVAALELEWQDLFPDGLDRPTDQWRVTGRPVDPPRPRTRPSGSGRSAPSRSRRDSDPGPVVARYAYRDESGAELFVKTRHHPKTFRVQGPRDARRVLYRLPELLAAVAAGRPVYVVEGEQDADRLAELGHIATCNFDGAARSGVQPKWRPEYGDALQGADVTIIRDRDDAGSAHAAAAYTDLLGKAASVRIVEPATDREHDDVSDHLDAGLGLELLRSVAPPVPAGTTAEAQDDGPQPLTPPRTPAPFPTNALPPVLADYVEALAHQTQTPPDMAGLCVLGAVAACAGGRVEVQARPGWREPVNIYGLVVMPPASRKSAVIADATRPLYQVETELAAKVDGEIVEAETLQAIATETAAKARRDAAGARPEQRAAKTADALAAATEAANITIPVRPRLLADDATPEAAQTLLAEQQGRMAFISAEGGLFDIMAGRYSDKVPQLDVWLKGHSGDPIRVDRKGRAAETIHSPALTLLLTAQPSVLDGIARNGQFRGRGLTARFLYAIPASNVGHREIGAAPVPASVAADYAERITVLARDLADLTTPAVLELDDDAAELLLDIERRIEPQLAPDGRLGHIAEWGGKLAGAVLRLAGLLHIADDPHGTGRPITADTLARADRLGEYLAEHASAALSRLGEAAEVTAAGYLLDHVLRHDLGEFTVRQLHRNLPRGRFPTTDSVTEALAVLEDHGWLAEQPAPPRKGPGRPPSPTYRLHPDARTAAR